MRLAAAVSSLKKIIYKFLSSRPLFYQKRILCWWYLVCCVCVCILYSISQMKTKVIWPLAFGGLSLFLSFGLLFFHQCVSIFLILLNTGLLRQHILCMGFCLAFWIEFAMVSWNWLSNTGAGNYVRPWVTRSLDLWPAGRRLPSPGLISALENARCNRMWQRGLTS